MNPIVQTLRQSWDWRVEIVLFLLLAAVIYTNGWFRLRHRSATLWHLLSYWAGLGATILALLSPIDILGAQLFLFHMIQHLLLLMVVPPLILLGQPFPVMLWGLPLSLRAFIAALFKRQAPFRICLQKLTSPILIWLLFVAVLWGWHLPAAYNIALQYSRIHDLEHLSFLLVGMLFWWHVIATAPRIHRRFSRIARIAYLLVTLPVNLLLGVIITLAPEPIYTYYLTVPRLANLTTMQDQMIGGVIMWVPGSMMFVVAALILVYQTIRYERDDTAWRSDWLGDEVIHI